MNMGTILFAWNLVSETVITLHQSCVRDLGVRGEEHTGQEGGHVHISSGHCISSLVVSQAA